MDEGGLPDDWFRPQADPPDGSAPSGPPEPTPALPPPDDDVTPTTPADRTSTKPPTASANARIPVLTSAAVAHRVPASAELVAPRRTWVLPALAVALSLLAGVVGGTLVREATRGVPASSPSPTVTTRRPAPSQAPPWHGATGRVAASSVAATCTAPDTWDAGGDPVDHDPSLVLDDDPDTAWRCNGDGVGQKLIFTFPAGTTLVGVGIINGYAKKEGKTSYYDQYRRVQSVRWDLPDGSWFIQNLSENNPTLQQLTTPAVTLPAGKVRMTILASSPPGQVGEATRDAVLVSQVAFWTPA